MSFRPNIPARMGQDVRPNLRNDPRIPNNRKNISQYNRTNNPQKFFSTTLICKRKRFIRLFCPHCHTRCLTFIDYKKHLHADKHLRALSRRIASVEKEVQLRRKEQEAAQATADKAAQLQGTSSAVVKYCAVCDLNFSQEESKHIVSKLHLLLLKLLEPKCNICNYQAKDAVDYENHICSLDHLKREEGWTGETDDSHQQSSEEASTSSESKTDKVPTSSEGKNDKTAPSGEGKSNEIPTSSGASEDQINSGASSEPLEDPMLPCGKDAANNVITKVEALYCSCCKVYFSCEEGQEEARIKHCATNQHIGMWMRFVEEKHKAQQALKE